MKPQLVDLHHLLIAAAILTFAMLDVTRTPCLEVPGHSTSSVYSELGALLGLYLSRGLSHFDEVALHLVHSLLQHLFWILHRADCISTSDSMLAARVQYASPSLTPHPYVKKTWLVSS